MIKKIAPFIVMIIHLHAVYAQEYVNLDKITTLDSAYLKFNYKLTYLRDSLKTNSVLTDYHTLLIGKTISKYYSQEKLGHNILVEEKFAYMDTYPSFPDGVWSCELFKNYPQDKITVCDIGSKLHGNYVYEESIPVFVWTLNNEVQKIMSYNCHKATTFFRGRNYIAWFTADIPIPNGPWQFGGLPGLILKLYDTKENFIFECTGIENLLNRKEPVEYYLVDYTKLSRKEYKQIEKRFYDDWVQYEKLHGVEMIILVDPVTGKQSKPTSLKLPYNPIELE